MEQQIESVANILTSLDKLEQLILTSQPPLTSISSTGTTTTSSNASEVQSTM